MCKFSSTTKPRIHRPLSPIQFLNIAPISSSGRIVLIIYNIGMVIFLALCTVPFFIALAWLCRGIALRYFAKTPRYYFGSAIIVGVAPSILITLILVLTSLRLYTGICYGLSDSENPCTFTEFIFDQTLWSMFITVPILILNLPASLILFVLGWKNT